MYFSKALTCAILSLALGAPVFDFKRDTGNAIHDGVYGSMTNAAQVQDTLNRQLQSADGHPTADVISAFITGADSQIDNFAGFLGEALDPVTFGISGQLANVALGPFAQSVTNGAEVLLSNLVGAPLDLIAGPAMKSYTQSLAKVSAAAKANKVDTSKLDSTIVKLNAKISAAKASTASKRDTGNAIHDGIYGSMTNAAQVQDTLNRQLQSGDGHPTADMISAFITGADSQIDNGIGFLGEALDPVTFGASGAIAGAALGPFAQSVTNGAEVLLSNLVGAPLDLIAGPAMKSYVQNLAKVSAASKANKVDTSKLDATISQLNAKISAASTKGKRDTGNAIHDGIYGSMTNAAQVQDTLNRQLQSGDGHPTADMISAFITGADSQIDNGIGFLGEALDPVTFGLSGAVAGAALGPFAQSVTNGAEVLLSNLVGAPLDLIAGPAMKSYVQNLSKVSAASKANKVDTSKLDATISQLNAKISAASAKGKRETGNAIHDGIYGSMTNAAQVQDTLSRQLQSGDGHPTADVISSFITGADSQIDNLAGFLGEALDPVTFGISGAIAGVALGPFAQSVTNGAEVLLSNLVGAPLDLIAGPAMKSYTQNLAKVSAAAKANKVDTSKLDAVTAQLNAKIAGAKN